MAKCIMHHAASGINAQRFSLTSSRPSYFEDILDQIPETPSVFSIRGCKQ